MFTPADQDYKERGSLFGHFFAWYGVIAPVAPLFVCGKYAFVLHYFPIINSHSKWNGQLSCDKRIT